jgi:hypothetical protein
MSQKRIILSDSSLNRYGYRVLTSGMLIEAFKKNPVMLYMHFRDEGSPIWGETKAIGHWEDIQLDGDVLSAIPVFDKVDQLSKDIAAKYEAGTYNAASVGIRIIATSANKDLLVPGQTRETVTECELMEASIVDIPANSNAVRLYDRSSSVFLAAGMDTNTVPALTTTTFNDKMNLKATWSAFLSFLNISKDNAETTELSAESLDSLHNEFSRLKSENGSLVQAKQDLDQKLANANTEITALKNTANEKDQEIATLKTEVRNKDTEITQLKEQVENLKKVPAPGGQTGPAPKTEPGEDAHEELATFCDKNEGNYREITERLKDEGLL